MSVNLLRASCIALHKAGGDVESGNNPGTVMMSQSSDGRVNDSAEICDRSSLNRGKKGKGGEAARQRAVRAG